MRSDNIAIMFALHTLFGLNTILSRPPGNGTKLHISSSQSFNLHFNALVVILGLRNESGARGLGLARRQQLADQCTPWHAA
jgi:hypothetical protein